MSQCIFQMLRVLITGGVFSSLYCFQKVEVEWVDALSVKAGAILKANLHPPKCSENPIPHHNIPTAVCYIIPQKKQLL